MPVFAAIQDLGSGTVSKMKQVDPETLGRRVSPCADHPGWTTARNLMIGLGNELPVIAQPPAMHGREARGLAQRQLRRRADARDPDAGRPFDPWRSGHGTPPPNRDCQPPAGGPTHPTSTYPNLERQVAQVGREVDPGLIVGVR